MIRASKHTNREPVPRVYPSFLSAALRISINYERRSTARTSIHFEAPATIAGGGSASLRRTRGGFVGKRKEHRTVHRASIYLLCSTRPCAYERGRFFESREACLKYRRGVGAGAAREYTRGLAIYFNERPTYARTHARTSTRARALVHALVRRYHLWLWIAVVYKFGSTLTDYKYRLSRSEYIINSFITAPVINNRSSRDTLGSRAHTFSLAPSRARMNAYRLLISNGSRALRRFLDRRDTPGVSILMELALHETPEIFARARNESANESPLGSDYAFA